MLRNHIQTYNAPKPDDLSVEPTHEVTVLLQFIDCTIAGFSPYYHSIKDSYKENRISDSLVYYFNTCLREQPYAGFPPFSFGKNPTQPNSDKETDIGVVILTKNIKPVTIVEFEAKRLSESTKYKEYVSGLEAESNDLKEENMRHIYLSVECLGMYKAEQLRNGFLKLTIGLRNYLILKKILILIGLIALKNYILLTL